LIRGRSSADGGDTWSDTFTIAGKISSAEEHYVPANLFAHDGRLCATVTEMAGKNLTTCLDLFIREGSDDDTWKLASRISHGFICNTPPIKMDNGNYISPCWMPMKQETPAFAATLISDGNDITKPWRCSFMYDPLRSVAVRLRCPETTLSVNGSNITAYVRNDEGPSCIFVSQDYGEHWNGPFINPMGVGNSKLYAGTLSNGKKYLIYNAERGYFVRTLLVMAVAEPGEGTYSKVYKLFENESDELQRGSIWFYPCACELDGYLYAACTLQEAGNVRGVVVAKVPVTSV
jgi:hypothetical protein